MLWVMIERMRLQVQEAEMGFLHSMTGVSLRYRIRSTDIWWELEVQSLLLHSKSSQLRWFGHLALMPRGRLSLDILAKVVQTTGLLYRFSIKLKIKQTLTVKHVPADALRASDEWNSHHLHQPLQGLIACAWTWTSSCQCKTPIGSPTEWQVVRNLQKPATLPKNAWTDPPYTHWNMIDFIMTRCWDKMDMNCTCAIRGTNCWTDHHNLRWKSGILPMSKAQQERGKETIEAQHNKTVYH